MSRSRMPRLLHKTAQRQLNLLKPSLVKTRPGPSPRLHRFNSTCSSGSVPFLHNSTATGSRISYAAASEASSAATYELHYGWLRDHCPCPRCIHPSTRQKTRSSGAVSNAPSLPKVEVDMNGLKVEWDEAGLTPDGNVSVRHTSLYPHAWIRNNARRIEPRARPTEVNDAEKHWLADDLPLANLWLDYDAYSTTNSAVLQALQSLKTYGICFVRNAPNRESSIEAIAERIGPIRETFYGRSWNVRALREAKNVAYTSVHLDMHMDLLYFENPPGLQILHCLQNSTSGGESLFVDSHHAASILERENPAAFRTLCDTPVLFHYDNDGHHLRRRHRTIELRKDADAGEAPFSVYYSPQFQGVLDALPTQKLDEFYQAFSAFEAVIRRPELLLKVLLDPGDAVLFANRRILHGRTAFKMGAGTPDDRQNAIYERWLKGTYVDWDAVLDRLRVLERAEL